MYVGCAVQQCFPSDRRGARRSLGSECDSGQEVSKASRACANERGGEHGYLPNYGIERTKRLQTVSTVSTYTVRYGRRSHTRSPSAPCSARQRATVHRAECRRTEEQTYREARRAERSSGSLIHPWSLQEILLVCFVVFVQYCTGSFGAGWMSAGAGRPSVAELA